MGVSDKTWVAVLDGQPIHIDQTSSPRYNREIYESLDNSLFYLAVLCLARSLLLSRGKSVSPRGPVEVRILRRLVMR